MSDQSHSKKTTIWKSNNGPQYNELSKEILPMQWSSEGLQCKTTIPNFVFQISKPMFGIQLLCFWSDVQSIPVPCTRQR